MLRYIPRYYESKEIKKKCQQVCVDLIYVYGVPHPTSKEIKKKCQQVCVDLIYVYGVPHPTTSRVGNSVYINQINTNLLAFLLYFLALIVSWYIS